MNSKRYISNKILLWLCISNLTLLNTVATQNVDSLLTIWVSTKDTLVADAIYSQAKKYFTKDIDSSLLLAIKSAELSERLKYTAGCINAYRGISAIAPRAGDNEMALVYIEKGIELIDQKNLPLKEKLNFIINKGASYLHQNKLGLAIEANIEAYQLAKSIGLKDKAGLILNNMGVLYRKTEEYEKAVETYKESIALREEMQDSIGIANSLYNLGATYAKIDSASLAFEVLNQAKSIFTKLNDQQSLLDCDLSIGTAAYDLGKYDFAQKILNEVEKNSKASFEPLE
ncbi:MAG: tetratricopeptide repeat protein, partial [Bacteroidota bacterium]